MDEAQLAPHAGCTTSTHWICIRSYKHYHKCIESIAITIVIGWSSRGNPSSKTSLEIKLKRSVCFTAVPLWDQQTQGDTISPRHPKLESICFNFCVPYCVSPTYISPFSSLLGEEEEDSGSLPDNIVICSLPFPVTFICGSTRHLIFRDMYRHVW